MQQRIGLSLAIDRLTKTSSLRSEFIHVCEEAANNRCILTFTCTKKGMTIIRDVWSAVKNKKHVVQHLLLTTETWMILTPSV